MIKNQQNTQINVKCIILCVAAFVILQNTNLVAQESEQPPVLPAGSTLSPIDQNRTVSKIISHAWPKSEPDYFNIRQAINRIEKDDAAMAKLGGDYKFQALQKKEDLLSLYGWAYINYKRGVRDREFLYPTEKIFHESYEWSRLRFLERMRNFGEDKWRSVAEKLLQYKADDSEVKFFLLRLLKPDSDLADRRLAIIYAEDIIKSDPLRASAHTARGSVYYRIWLITKDVDDARKAVNSYRRYLELAPEKDGFRSRAKDMVEEMTSSHKSSLE